MINWHERNNDRRNAILEKIKPLLDLFEIEEYDYEIIENSPDGYNTTEYLIINGQKINCDFCTIESIFYEAFGYLIVNRYCYRKDFGRFTTQVKNIVKTRWAKEC